MRAASSTDDSSLEPKKEINDLSRGRLKLKSIVKWVNAVEAKDPNQIGRVKKMPGLDRILIDQAFKERRKNMNSV